MTIEQRRWKQFVKNKTNRSAQRERWKWVWLKFAAFDRQWKNARNFCAIQNDARFVVYIAVNDAWETHGWFGDFSLSVLSKYPTIFIAVRHFCFSLCRAYARQQTKTNIWAECILPRYCVLPNDFWKGSKLILAIRLEFESAANLRYNNKFASINKWLIFIMRPHIMLPFCGLIFNDISEKCWQ